MCLPISVARILEMAIFLNVYTFLGSFSFFVTSILGLSSNNFKYVEMCIFSNTAMSTYNKAFYALLLVL